MSNDWAWPVITILGIVAGTGVGFWIGHDRGAEKGALAAHDIDDELFDWEHRTVVRLIESIVDGQYPESVEVIRLWGHDIRIRPKGKS